MSIESGPPTGRREFHELFVRFHMQSSDVALARTTLESIATAARDVVEQREPPYPGRLAKDIALFRRMLGRSRADALLQRLSIDPDTASVTDVTRWQNRIPSAPFPVTEELVNMRNGFRVLADIALHGGMRN